MWSVQFIFLTALGLVNIFAENVDFVSLVRSETAPDWWETASFYQIYPRSFKDSDGDGIGDLNGVRQKLTYLRELGINATWLSPIFKSPMKDFGYDISDFFSIQPEYGTMEDFTALLQATKAAGIKLILDFVPNHSSDLNEWFLKSARRESGFEDFYIWHPGHPDPKDANNTLVPNNWVSVFRGSAWEWNEIRREFYYHAFAVQQPDLNYRDPKVVAMMKSVLRFWLDKGVDGFRVDAVPFLFEVMPDGQGRFPDEPLSGNTDDPLDYGYLNHVFTQGQEATYDMIYQWRAVLDQHKRDHGGDTRVMLTEAYADIADTMRYYGDGKGRDGAHIPMNFLLITQLNHDSNARAFKDQIDMWLLHMPVGRTANWVLGNHDQRRVGSRFGPERIDLLNMIVLMLPGVSITYMGEEIGMTDVWISWPDTKDPQACNTNPEVYDAHSRDPARTPFQWDGTTSAGFSINPSTWLPVSPTYGIVNVQVQEEWSQSHLQKYKAFARLRHQVLRHYDRLETYTMAADEVLVLVRSVTASRGRPEPPIIAMANIGGHIHTVDVTKILKETTTVDSLEYVIVDAESDASPGDKVDATKVTLYPHESFVLRASMRNAQHYNNYYKYDF